MKFSSGIDQLQRENTNLKTAVAATSLLVVVLICACLSLYDRPPIMIERSSRGLEIVSRTNFHLDEDATKAAVKLMMLARFNTDAISPEVYLNQKQLILRDNEQKELKSRNMHQSVVVRNVAFGKNEATVDVDRVISVGDIRSALKTKLKITFEEEQPNELNPYGLLLSLAEPVQAKPSEHE